MDAAFAVDLMLKAQAQNVIALSVILRTAASNLIKNSITDEANACPLELCKPAYHRYVDAAALISPRDAAGSRSDAVPEMLSRPVRLMNVHDLH
ncbi:hypothetical protein FF100_36155 [Methylobacterium terricola]|uniref:Uncharacterized protein n=1 Tax=Methylobacterium terricola TaxID=2583531 RepID=A0A5C4L7F0_9HYPH|nr:hypothetical protein [Methylobacterium terricola]TNC05122.1 hypothetical protein FF100_36155 [Methylobacterium terricola]